MKYDYEDLVCVFEELEEPAIVMRPVYKKITGSYAASCLLAQCIFWYKWAKKNKRIEFYKTDSEFMEELSMTEKELRNAKDKLKELKLINVTIKGIPRLCHYSVNYNIIIEKIKENALNTAEPSNSAQRAASMTPLTYQNDKKAYYEQFIRRADLDPSESSNTAEPSNSAQRAASLTTKGRQPYIEAETTTETTKDILAQISEKTEQNQPVAVLKENGVCVQDINQENQENSQETPIKHNYSEAFLKWWDIYPKKLSKESAYSAYKKTIKRINPKDLNVRTEIYVELEKHLDPQFIPYPGSWLNAGRWMDEGVEKQFELQKQKTTPDKIDMESFLPRESGPWRSVLEDLYKNIGKPAYLSWIKGNLDPIPETSLKLLKIENNTAYLQAATGFIVDKLKNDYDKDIKSAIVKNYAGVQNIEICKSC